jgi:transposase
VARPEAVFVDALVRDLVQQPPGEAAARELGLPEGAPPPARWQLRTIRASLPDLAGYSLPGVWGICQRAGVRLRLARIRQQSPDPAYSEKRDRLLAVLGEMAADPVHVVVVFLDEMGIRRQPEPARTYALAAPAPPPQTHPAGREQKHRIAGMLDAQTGRVLLVDGHDAGRARLAQLYRTLDRTYPAATRIYVVQDNWPIHKHADLDALLTQLPRIERVWLPVAAHWLNPIEKLWRLVRQRVLYLHQQAADWLAFRRTVRRYLRQFADGSPELLHTVGLLGDGLLARARRGDLPIPDLRSET